MKKVLIISLALLVLAGGPLLYFGINSDAPITEEFSSFGFKNDAVERPVTEGEGEWYTDDLNTAEDVSEYEEYETYESDRRTGGSSGGNSGTEPVYGVDIPAYDANDTPSYALPATGQTNTAKSSPADGGASAPSGNTTSTAKPFYTLTIVLPTAGSVLRNTSGADIAKIFWAYGDYTARITIELWNKNGLVRTLATKVTNSGRYAWGYSPTLADGDYKLVIKAYSPTGTLLASRETGYFEVSRTKNASEGNPPSGAGEALTFTSPSERFHPEVSGGETASYGFSFVGYEMGKITIAEDGESPAGDTSRYAVWLSKTPGGTPIGQTLVWQYTGGAVTFASGPNPYNAQVLTPGTYYFNVTANVDTSHWIQINLTKDVAGISGGSSSAETDINGKVIPSTPTGPVAASMCEGMNSVSNPDGTWSVTTPKAPSPGLGGYNPCGSYKIKVADTGYNCSSNRAGAGAVRNAYLYVLENIDHTSLRNGNSIRFSLANDSVMVFKFTTGPSANFLNLPGPGGIAYDEHVANGPSAGSVFMSLSEEKCDFDYSKVYNPAKAAEYAAGTADYDACYKMAAYSDSLQTTVRTDTPSAGDRRGRCQLKPDTTYYLSLRYDTVPASFTNPNPGNSCTAGNYCGQVVNFNIH